MNTLTEKERQAVSLYAKEYSSKFWTNLQDYEKESILLAGAEFLAEFRKEEAPSEEITSKIVGIFESYQTESECPECDTCVPFKSVQQYDYEKASIEIAKLLTPDVNAELLAFAEWTSINQWRFFPRRNLWFGIDRYKRATTNELYEQFQNAQKQLKL